MSPFLYLKWISRIPINPIWQSRKHKINREQNQTWKQYYRHRHKVGVYQNQYMKQETRSDRFSMWMKSFR